MNGIKIFVVLGGVAALGVFGAWVTIMQPMAVPVAEVVPTEVKLSFTEEGFVKDEDIIDIYSVHPGAVASVYVTENQKVKKGDVLCQIDDSKLRHDLETEINNQRGYASQIKDLDLQEAQRKDGLRASRNQLQGDLEAVLGEEASANSSYLSAGVTKEEEINLQNIVIEQSRTDLQTAKENLQKIETLYTVGAVSQQELSGSREEVQQKESALNQNISQLEVIKSSNEEQSREAYFQGAKQSIQGQLSAIDTQMGSTYSQAMKEYYNSQIENSQVSVALLEKQIAECIVKAPADGVIAKLYIDNSNVADVETPLATLSTGFDSLVEVYVPTSEIGSVHINDMVELELKSDMGSVYFGTVTEIDTKAEIRTSSLGVEKRKVKVTAQPLAEFLPLFKPGYDLTAGFTTYHEKGKLTVPRTAVDFDGENSAVWVVAEGRLQRREIEIERELNTEYVVGSGLLDGELVVKDASLEGLIDGKSVKAN